MATCGHPGERVAVVVGAAVAWPLPASAQGFKWWQSETFSRGLGLTQDQMLLGDAHWVIRVLHLLVGLGAIGQSEGLAVRIRRARAVPVRP